MRVRRGATPTLALLVAAVALVATTLVLAPAPPPAAADGNEAPGNPAAYRSLTAGAYHTCSLRVGVVKCWGFNFYGQLGLGDTAYRGDDAGEMGAALPAVDLGTGRTATALTAGRFHTCALLDNGTVKCWGNNDSGKLGVGSAGHRGDVPGEMGDNLPPVNLGTGRTAVAIAAGVGFTCALLDNAGVKCWGENELGSLGLGDTTSRGLAAGQMGDNLPTVSLGSGRTAVAITAGGYHACAILDNASLKCWGYNGNGQLGLGDADPRGDNAGEMGDALPAVSLGSGRTATVVTGSEYHTCARLDDATVKCWGRNDLGQLGLGDTVPRGDNAGEMGNSLPAVALGTGRTAMAVAAADAATCAQLDNATLKCWGDNSDGQLGLGDTNPRGDGAGEMGNSLPAISLGTGRSVVAVSGGNSHACAQLDNGNLKCWGRNSSGQLGLGNTAHRGDNAGEMGDNLPAVPVEGRRAVAVAAGTFHACAILDNGRVRCWGYNASGQLGLGDTATRADAAGEMGDNLPTVDLGAGRTAVAIGAGESFTCALLDNAMVKCWGENESGQLGQGDTNDRGDGAGEMGDNLLTVPLGTGRTVTALTVGGAHACARLDNSTLKCWGRNDQGQLGLGNVNDRGDAAGEMGNNLPVVNLGGALTPASVSAGYAHTCARLSDSTLKCWGLNHRGQLGLGDTNNRGDAILETGNDLPTVNLGTGRTALAVTLGNSHTCARLDNNTTKCWGANLDGQIGFGASTFLGDAPGEMGDALPTVSLGSGRTANVVEAGGDHTCARLDNNKLKCWGFNFLGTLGLGDQTYRGDNANEMGDNLPNVALGTGRRAVSLDSLGQNTCALLDNGTVKCWGSNFSGQLGLGDANHRGDAAGEMGDALPAVDLGSASATGLWGRVVDSVSSAPVANAFVAVLRSSDFTLAGGATADAGGNYYVDVGAGSYYLYLIDPSATHTVGFSTPNPLRTVNLDAVTTAMPTMAPNRGNLAGTVREDTTNTPIAGAYIITLTSGGVPELGNATNGSGVYAMNGLPAGNHYVGFVDPTGAHVTEFAPNSSTVPGATPQTITGGVTTTVNDSMATQTPIGTGANLTGTVTETGTGTPIANAIVVALRSSDFKLARGTVTNASGIYTLNVVAGAYYLAFIDTQGLRNMEWHNNQPSSGLATATTVSAPATTNASLARNYGSMTGTVLDGTTNQPLTGAWVIAINSNGIVARGATTAANGTYTLNGLAPGTYRVTFVDPTAGRPQEYWDNAPDYATAGTLNVTAGANINSVDGAIG